MIDERPLAFFEAMARAIPASIIIWGILALAGYGAYRLVAG